METENKQLFNVSEEEYGSLYKAHFLEQYKLFFNSIEKMIDRRHAASNFFLTINTALATLIGLSFKIDLGKFNFARALIPFIGIIVALIFWSLIKYYSRLIATKYAIIKEIEERLPVGIFEKEWLVFYKQSGKRKHTPSASRLEMSIPWIFGIIHLVIAIVFICF